MTFAVLPEPAAANLGDPDEAESVVHYLRRSTRPFAAATPRLLNQWGSELDTSTAAGVLSRLRVDDNGQFRGAFLEMFLEQMFHQAGWVFDREPLMPSSPRRPDFVIRDGNIVMEATTTNPNARQGRTSRKPVAVSTGPAGERTASFDPVEEQRMSLLVDRLNSDISSSRPFTVSGEAWDVGSHLPPARKLDRPLDAWLATLDPDQVDPDQPVRWSFSDQGWLLEFLAFPTPAELRETPTRTVEPLFSSIGTAVIDHETLRGRLLDKSPSKYGVAGCPYVIAVDEDSWLRGSAELHRREALFGDRRPQLVGGQVQWVTQSNGFWHPARRTACSAVLLVAHLSPWNALYKVPELWLNPWANMPMSIKLPFWRIHRLLFEEHGHGRFEVTEPTVTPQQFWGETYSWWFDAISDT